MFKKRIKTIEVNNALLNILAPMGLDFGNKNFFWLGENKAKIYGITKYPKEPNFGWLSKITNISNVVTRIDFNPINDAGFLNAISKNINSDEFKMATEKDALVRSRAKSSVQNAERMMESVDQKDEKVGIVTIVQMATANEEQKFQNLTDKLIATAAASRCTLRCFSFLQKEAFEHILPYYSQRKEISDVAGRVMPLQSLMGGLPFATNGISDQSGYILAHDKDNGLIILDSWKRGGDRINSNWTILGPPGSGKSTTIKKLITAEWKKGTKILIIDPEREYKDLTLNLGGSWINAAGGTGGNMNVFEIRKSPLDDNEELEKDDEEIIGKTKGLGDLAMHIKTLEISFKLYKSSIDDTKKGLIKRALIQMYKNFKITWDTDVDTLNSEDYPTWKDFYDTICKFEEIDLEWKREWQELKLLFEDIAIGADSFIFNGKSDVKSDGKIICFDTNGLENCDESIKRTQYFNILSYCWSLSIEDRSQPVMLVSDENYLMIDPRVPESLIFMKNYAKRCRKYEASLVVATHSVVDYLDPSIKKEGQALLDLPCYKLILGADGQNLEEIKKLYNLTDTEEELLLKKERGKGLLMIGSRRIESNIYVSDRELELFGKAGGR